MLQNNCASERCGARSDPTLRLFGGATPNIRHFWFDDRDTRWSQTLRRQVAPETPIGDRGVARAWRFY